MASYLRLHAIRSDYKRKSGRFNIGFGLFIYILIPFLVFLKILCTLQFFKFQPQAIIFYPLSDIALNITFTFSPTCLLYYLLSYHKTIELSIFNIKKYINLTHIAFMNTFANLYIHPI